MIHEKKKIYIVEDHPQNIELYEAIFNKMDGVELIIETTGDKGLELIKSGEPDLIILDYKVPELNGIDICKELRALDKFKEIPIIAVSSSPIKGNKEEIFMNAGFDMLLTKPLKVNEFRKLVLSYLD